MAGALGGNHDHVDVLGRLDAAVVDVEAVSKGQGFALGQVGLDALLVQGSLLFVVDQDHDHVGNLGGLVAVHDLHALSLSLGPALGAGIQADYHVHTAFLQIQRVCVALGAVADDGNGLACQLLEITVLLIKNSLHCNVPLSL